MMAQETMAQARKMKGRAARAKSTTEHLPHTVERWSDVPRFATEDEEAEYWATHELGGEALAQMGRGPTELLPEPPEAFAASTAPGDPAGPRTRSIAIRLDQDVLRRLKAVAARKHKGYQTLLKEFVVERLYQEELREGLIPQSRE
jgi:hypothetical protein